jgi:hypothetical protein
LRGSDLSKHQVVPPTDPEILRFFDGSHLADAELRTVIGQFHQFAVGICAGYPPSAERSVALRKLLEAKDATMRCHVMLMDKRDG